MSKWLGDVPKTCDLCVKPILNQFIDGKTIMGPWGIMCRACHRQRGVGLGLGKGQEYQYQGGQWVKVSG